MPPAERRLRAYRDKRDFSHTPEPSGARANETAAGAPRFVVQRHRARRLHYDFRLEIDGVLVSWAVPKGLTLDPTARHLAVHVEDHPLEYIDFEGVIPRGEYGGGDVIVWDRGTWEPHATDDPARAVAEGELHVDLFGEKLKGRIVLVRTGRGSADKEQWLVLHKKDAEATPGWDPEDHPRSVLSGLTNDEVAAHPTRMWTPDGERALVAPVPEIAGPDDDELAALDALGEKGTWELQSRSIALTNLNKELFRGLGRSKPLTKRDLIRYYASIAPVMVPYLLDRPLNLHRFPDGADAKGFWQKQAPTYTPDWMRQWRYEGAGAGKSESYIVVESAADLAWLANHAALELHAWTSRIPEVDEPTYALIDIDPGSDTSWNDLVTLVRLHRTALEHLGVRGYPKLSGQRGVQVWVPIVPGPSFSDARAWVERLSRTIGVVAGDLVSWQWEKDERGGRARLDYTQNAINKTLVAPYSVRPSAGAPVSVPIEWDEIEDPDLRSDHWTIRTVLERVQERGDPMAAMLRDAQPLPELDDS